MIVIIQKNLGSESHLGSTGKDVFSLPCPPLALIGFFFSFGYKNSRSASSYSSSVLSCSIANLPIHYKYRPNNLAIYGLTPGPTEWDSDKIQGFKRRFVTDLVNLCDNGVLIKTPLFPEGWCVQVVLVAVCCDHLVMCHMCGFGDH
jgi:hypothetical protein